MDLQRVGVTNHIVGGLGGMQGLVQHPDFYKVGINATPIDRRIMSASMWGEKYADVSGEKASQLYPEMIAHKLEGKLLLIHGMLDIMCPPAAVYRLVDALQKANKDFDLLTLPNLGHSPSSYAVRRSWDFLVRHLMNVEPPKEFKLSTRLDTVW